MLYINLYSNAGFGNILFQVLNGLNLSIEYNTELYFIDYIESRKDRPNFKKYDIFKNLNIIQKTELSQLNQISKKNMIEIKEQTEFHYDKIFLGNDNYILSGYFQSYKYFYDNLDKIKDILFN